MWFDVAHKRGVRHISILFDITFCDEGNGFGTLHAVIAPAYKPSPLVAQGTSPGSFVLKRKQTIFVNAFPIGVEDMLY
jgi:hypothetical protein